MTTIAYHHESKTIAVDGRVTTSSGVIDTDKANKIIERDGMVWVVAGSVAGAQSFVDSYPDSNGVGFDCLSIAVIDGCAYTIGQDEDGGYITEKLERNWALGTGEQFALAAMDFGKGAKGAVKYAMTRDCFSGGKITTIKVK